MFRHYLPTKLLFGWSSLERLPEEINSLKLDTQRVAVICSPSAVAHGTAGRVAKMFPSSEVEIFDSVEPDPTVENALLVLNSVSRFKPTLIVAVGGGSPLDVAKAVSVLLENPGSLESFIGVPEPFEKPGVPLVAVPTTAGSGSEVTPYAVLTDRKKLRKAPLISSYLYPKLAVVDPELTLTLPREVTANSGVDALTHALESYLTQRRTPISSFYSLEATSLLLRYLPKAFGNPNHREARTKVMFASTLAGMAIADAGAGLVHTLAHVVGVLYRLPHGLANGLFLVPVIRFYGLSVKDDLNRIASFVGLNGAEDLLSELERLLTFLRIPRRLSQVGIPSEDIPKIASMAMAKKFLMGSLPKIPTERELIELLQTLV
ncbi:iron-containing alcohol dehydrogenase family protein [Thermovibrio ammonificans]